MKMIELRILLVFCQLINSRENKDMEHQGNAAAHKQHITLRVRKR